MCTPTKNRETVVKISRLFWIFALVLCVAAVTFCGDDDDPPSSEDSGETGDDDTDDDDDDDDLAPCTVDQACDWVATSCPQFYDDAAVCVQNLTGGHSDCQTEYFTCICECTVAATDCDTFIDCAEGPCEVDYCP
jgi:hypothetical protein